MDDSEAQAFNTLRGMGYLAEELNTKPYQMLLELRRDYNDLDQMYYDLLANTS